MQNQPKQERCVVIRTQGPDLLGLEIVDNPLLSVDCNPRSMTIARLADLSGLNPDEAEESVAHAFELLTLRDRLALLGVLGGTRIFASADLLDRARTAAATLHEEMQGRRWGAMRAVVRWMEGQAAAWMPHRLEGSGSRPSIGHNRTAESESSIHIDPCPCSALQEAVDALRDRIDSELLLIESVRVQDSSHPPELDDIDLRKQHEEFYSTLRDLCLHLDRLTMLHVENDSTRFPQPLPTAAIWDADQAAVTERYQAMLMELREQFEFSAAAVLRDATELSPQVVSDLDWHALCGNARAIFNRLQEMLQAFQGQRCALFGQLDALTESAGRVGFLSLMVKPDQGILQAMAALASESHLGPGVPLARELGAMVNPQTVEKFRNYLSAGAHFLLCRDQFDRLLGFAVVWPAEHMHRWDPLLPEIYGDLGRTAFVSHLCVSTMAAGVPVERLLKRGLKLFLSDTDLLAGRIATYNYPSLFVNQAEGGRLFPADRKEVQVAEPESRRSGWTPDNSALFVGMIMPLSEAACAQVGPAPSRREAHLLSRLLLERSLPSVFNHEKEAATEGLARATQHQMYLQWCLESRCWFERAPLGAIADYRFEQPELFWVELTSLLPPWAERLLGEFDIPQRTRLLNAGPIAFAQIREIVLTVLPASAVLRKRISRLMHDHSDMLERYYKLGRPSGKQVDSAVGFTP